MISTKRADDIKAAREEAGLTTREFSELTGVAQPNIVMMENGKRKITDKMFARLKADLAWYTRKPTKREAKASKKAAERAVLATMPRET